MRIASTGIVVARNALTNFVTQGIVAVVALISIPVLVRRMGEDAFGVLTMVWMAVGYFSILDLGVGQAGVKYLAEQMSREEFGEANVTVWVSVAVSALLGTAATVAMIAVTPLLVGSVFAIPSGMRPAAEEAFLWGALAIPFVMVQGAFRAVPVSVQRFDLVNLLQGLSGVAQWGGAILLVLGGSGLREIVLLTLAIRVLGAGGSLWITKVLLPGLSPRKVRNFTGAFVRLLKFGSWVTVSQAVSPIVRYLDRVFVATFHSLRLFTFYVVPYEAVSRLQMIPMSISTVLFPALAERSGVQGAQAPALRGLYRRTLHIMVVVMLPVGLFLVLFSREILQLWLGGEFPALSTLVFQILALAVVVQAVAHVPVTALQAIGRPDMAARFYLAEIPLYVALCLWLIPSYAIEGAAVAWLVRLLLITAGLLWATHRALGPAAAPMRRSFLGYTLVLNGVFCGLLWLLKILINSLPLMAAVVVGAGLLYGFAVWNLSLDPVERDVVRGLVQRRR